MKYILLILLLIMLLAAPLDSYTVSDYIVPWCLATILFCVIIYPIKKK